MERLKEIWNKLLHPGVPVMILCVLAGAGLLVYAFGFAGEDSPVSYGAYVFSAYALLVLCVNVVPALQKGKALVCRNPYLNRYLKDVPFKLRVSLYASFAINLLYAAVNVFSGLYYRSAWFGSLAAYYTCLAVMRFSLVRYTQRQGFGENRTAEWRRCRLCGGMLALMNIALIGVVILVLHQEGSFDYAGMMIYVMAMYAFYVTVMAVVNLVRYRKYHSPVMSAAKAVNLAAALVSMLSLEIGMLNQFGTESEAAFREIMIAATGGAVCAIVAGSGIYMVVRASKALKTAGHTDGHA